MPPRLLRARRERPRGCAADQRDEIASLHALPPQGVRVAHYHSVAGERCCCITAKLIVEWQIWVINRPTATSALSPFDSQLRTLVCAARRSHSCQLLTRAMQRGYAADGPGNSLNDLVGHGKQPGRNGG
jgi:hypothetical protein